MKKIIIAIIVLVVLSFLTYFLVFKSNSAIAPINPVYNPVASDLKDKIIIATSTPINSPAEITVNIKNFSFIPASLVVKIGTKVTWINNDTAPHTVTSDTGNLLNSANLSPGQSFSYTFSSTGVDNYHCAIHPMMRGQVIVTK